MDGPGVASVLYLDSNLHLGSGTSTKPQPLRFTTTFSPGNNGLVLSSLATGEKGEEASFSFDYQTADGFQLPANVTVAPSTKETWHYSLTDCKVSKSETITIGPPQP
jgi:hypothetical protein